MATSRALAATVVIEPRTSSPGVALYRLRYRALMKRERETDRQTDRQRQANRDRDKDGGGGRDIESQIQGVKDR